MPSKLVMLSWNEHDGPLFPSHELPGGPVYPSHGLPGGPVYPSHGLPPYPGHPIQLPVFPFDPTLPDQSLPPAPARPDQGLPPSPGTPDNTLPSPGRPSLQPIIPGAKFIVKWVACIGLALVPDNSLPPFPEPK